MRKNIWILCAILACQLQLFANKGFITLNVAGNNVDIISTDSNVIQGTFADQSITALNLAISPDGTIGIIVNEFTNRVAIFDTRTLAVQVVTGPNISSRFFDVAFTPDGKKAFVTDFNFDQVFILDVATRSFEGTPIAVGNNPFGIAITPDGTKAFVANIGPPSSISVIDLSTLAVTTILSPSFNQLVGVAITPDSKKALITSFGNNLVFVIDTNTLNFTSIPVGNSPEGIDITPDGKTAYVGNLGGNSVSVVDISANQVTHTIGGFSAPRFLAVTPDGKRVYVPNSNTITTSIVDIATNMIIGTITESSFGPWAVAFIPNPKFTLAACQKKNVFLTQTDRFNVITITAIPNTPQIVNFRIFRDPDLTQQIAQISAKGGQFCDHGRKKGQCCTYFVVATDIFGDSVTESITVGSK